MTLSIELTEEEKNAVERAAKERDMEVGEFVRSLILPSSAAGAAAVTTGEELVSYWQREGLIGTRADIHDSATHARALRDEAQRRIRSS
jgi:hypothetical protein